jgi:DNA-binding transcriptional MocR family regulator
MARNPYLEYVDKQVKGISRTEKQVLMKLCGFMVGDNTRQCMDASLDTMAGWFSVSKSTVQRAIKELEGRGLIYVASANGRPCKLFFGSVFWDAFDNKIDVQFPNRPRSKRPGGVVKMTGDRGQNDHQLRRQERQEGNSTFSSAFPSLHYASVNLVAYPAKSKSTAYAPTGGF